MEHASSAPHLWLRLLEATAGPAGGRSLPRIQVLVVGHLLALSDLLFPGLVDDPESSGRANLPLLAGEEELSLEVLRISQREEVTPSLAEASDCGAVCVTLTPEEGKASGDVRLDLHTGRPRGSPPTAFTCHLENNSQESAWKLRFYTEVLLLHGIFRRLECDVPRGLPPPLLDPAEASLLAALEVARRFEAAVSLPTLGASKGRTSPGPQALNTGAEIGNLFSELRAELAAELRRQRLSPEGLYILLRNAHGLHSSGPLTPQLLTAIAESVTPQILIGALYFLQKVHSLLEAALDVACGEASCIGRLQDGFRAGGREVMQERLEKATAHVRAGVELEASYFNSQDPMFLGYLSDAAAAADPSPLPQVDSPPRLQCVESFKALEAWRGPEYRVLHAFLQRHTAPSPVADTGGWEARQRETLARAECCVRAIEAQVSESFARLLPKVAVKFLLHDGCMMLERRLLALARQDLNLRAAGEDQRCRNDRLQKESRLSDLASETRRHIPPQRRNML